MTTPIIVPMHTTTQRDYIIEEGVKYCENTDVTAHELGFILVGAAMYVIWFGLWIYLSTERNWNDALCMFMAIVFPLLLIGSILIF